MDNNVIKEFIKSHAYFLAGIACVIIVGIIYVMMNRSGAEVIRNGEVIYSANEENENTNETTETAAEPADITVHITGAVNNPGVFVLPRGARVNDALESAGGATENADLEHRNLNLAMVLRDETRIIIPEIGEEIEDVLIFADALTNNGGVININTATWSELQTLSGVGPVLAQNIIDYREANGGFSSVDELINVNRIGAVTLENLRPFVTVN